MKKIFLFFILTYFANAIEVEMLSNKTFSSKYHFFQAGELGYLLAVEKNDKEVELFEYTKDRKWKPLSNADAFDGYKKANNKFDSIKYNRATGELVIGKYIGMESILPQSKKADSMGNEDEHFDADNNIRYLKDNHKQYSNTRNNSFPAPVKNIQNKSIIWSITANTEEQAKKLQGHIHFMTNKLKNDKNPRPFDKLFIMEAYMKFNRHYSTDASRASKVVSVSKIASTECAYKVISAHSDVVSGDFFAKGIINKDHSSTAEAILKDSSCESEKVSIEAYIKDRHKTRGKGSR